MMLALDTSAVVAVLRNEPEAQQFLEIMIAADSVLISAATYAEAGIVMDTFTPRSRKPLADLANNFSVLLREIEAEIVPVSEALARSARVAYRRYGKGTGHKAQLNFGDCFAYALAIDLSVPLLFKGNDFRSTDVARAVE